MDINLCIDHLRLNQNSYKLNQSNPPHRIIYWDETNPDKKPTDGELAVAWAEIEADQKATKYQRDRQAEYPSIEELVVALYDSEDKAEIDRRRAEVKNKYPKP